MQVFNIFFANLPLSLSLSLSLFAVVVQRRDRELNFANCRV